ncbi:uncharacterized protein LOC132723977 [Ruditapes philippinarum]|uniref:uncharacterized protein LOC132723977 n=1 Tax=Ruditapes philippinarum TaxID=129788 RepID=UPI00295A9546|nr:uncharacterized protein LOC132723977 [Ruditapes philippinarum]
MSVHDRQHAGSDGEINLSVENRKLLTEIENLCSNTRRKVENVLLIGKVGAGKSSLINSVRKALTGQYIPKAPAGKGSSSSKTKALERFERCGVEEDDLIHDRDRYMKISHVPTIFDFPGLGDTEFEGLEEILDLIIKGDVAPYTSLRYLIESQNKTKNDHEKECELKQPYPNSKISTILFVQSCRESAPKNLISCLQKVLDKSGPDGKLLYTGKVHVVMTKFDLVNHQDNSDDETTEMISEDNYMDIENDMADLFNIDGNRQDNLTKWTSYSDRLDAERDNPAVDNSALKLIKMIMTHGTQAELMPAKPMPAKPMPAKPMPAKDDSCQIL